MRMESRLSCRCLLIPVFSCSAVMKKIMFVCHGNICRSPMAEFIMKDLVRKAFVADEFHIASSATSREEIGNPVYPPAAYTLSMHGIGCNGHSARQLIPDDCKVYDMIVVMEDYNIRNLERVVGLGCDKVWKLLDFVEETPRQRCGRDISDPWYHGNFDKTYKEIMAGCKALLRYLGY